MFFPRLIDLAWPRTCAVEGCGRPCDRAGRYLCSSCFANLPWHEAGSSCKICGRLVATAETHEFACDACRDHLPAYERARSAVKYVEPVASLIGDFKYRKATWLTEDFVDLLEGAARAKLEAAAVDVVMPVPLHVHRLFERGYNQSERLARGLAARLDRAYDGTSLVRRQDTEHQARLGGDARRQNLRGAFAVTDPARVRGRTVLVVDDVSTTGTTLDECAKVLRAAGAVRTWCLTVARGVERAIRDEADF